MSKSNWIIVAILAVASIVFLAMYYSLGFNVASNPLDLIFTIVWWVVILAVCVAISWAESRRRRSMRTAFVAPGTIYNIERGIVKVPDDEDAVDVLEEILSHLKYNFDKRNIDNGERIRFKYIVRTDKFKENGSIWTGEVVRVSKPDDVTNFTGKFELRQLIDVG